MLALRLRGHAIVTCITSFRQRVPTLSRNAIAILYRHATVPKPCTTQPRRSLNHSHSTPTHDDTIYALSTAPGRAAIAVVRVSGPASLQIYSSLCPGKAHPKARVASLRRLHDPSTGDIIDTGALILYFPGPKTVTGEDVLELHTHGGNAIVRGVLNAIPRCTTATSKLRIRAAEPGEFTRRAFYNSRLDLTEVEALGESLNAETEQQRRLAVSGASNTLSTRYEKWRTMLLHARGELEALIDFSEDQHFEESPAHLMAGTTKLVKDLKRQIDLHILNASRGELLRSGINVALLGAPNAGKSSLLNLIVGREAAIVSAEEGTTRDIVDVSIDLKGWLINLGDMAGVRAGAAEQVASQHVSSTQPAVGAVEREGIRRARERALQSDLVIVLVSVSLKANGKAELVLNTELQSAIEECHKAGKHLVFAINKVDLLHIQSVREMVTISRLLNDLVLAFPFIDPNTVFCLSCNSIDQPHGVGDDNGLQNFLAGLISKFSQITQAAVGTTDGMSAADARSYWTASLNVTHRQREYLTQCLVYLQTYLESTSPTEKEDVPVPLNHSQRKEVASPVTTTHSFFDTSDNDHASSQQYLTDGHEDLIAEAQARSKHGSTTEADVPQDTAQDAPLIDTPELDIVAAAEHLRGAADCLSKLTGRGDAVSSGTDVEDVLGVIFEK